LHLGRYDLKVPLFTSGTVVVWAAEDKKRRKKSEPARVALKVMLDVDAFGREMQMRAKRLNPAFVVEVVRHHEPQMTLVMPLAEKTLESAIASEIFAGTDIDRIRMVARQMASCLQHLHENGIIHGDFKPKNVVLLDGMWKVIDFDSSASLGGILGSRVSSAYCAPELAEIIFGPLATRTSTEIEKQLIEQHVQLKDLQGEGSLKRISIMALRERGDTHDIELAELKRMLADIKDLEDDLAMARRLEARDGDHTAQVLSPALDCWSYGVVLFKLVFGHWLFKADFRDNLSTQMCQRELLHWRGLPGTDAEQLSRVFPHARGKAESAQLRASALDLLRQCLEPDSTKRIPMRDILNHPFLSPRPSFSKVLICSAPERGLDPRTSKFDMPVMERLQALSKHQRDFTVA
jgi:serine/threonine protein kinase